MFSKVVCSALLYSEVVCSALVYSAIVCSEVVCSPVVRSLVLYSEVVFSAVVFSAIVCSAAVNYCFVQCSTVQNSAVQWRSYKSGVSPLFCIVQAMGRHTPVLHTALNMVPEMENWFYLGNLQPTFFCYILREPVKRHLSFKPI